MINNNNSNKKLRGFFLKVLLSLVVFSSYGLANDDKEAKKEALEKEKNTPNGLVYDKDSEKRFTEGLTLSEEYKRHGNDYAKYPRRIAEELQCYGGNTFINFLETKGSYTKRFCAMCAII